MITKLANDLNEEITTPGWKDHSKAGAIIGAASGAILSPLIDGMASKKMNGTFLNGGTKAAKIGNLAKGVTSGALGGAIGGAAMSPGYRLEHKLNRVVGGEDINDTMSAQEVNEERQRAAVSGARKIYGTVSGLTGALAGAVAPTVAKKMGIGNGGKLMSAAGGIVGGVGGTAMGTLYGHAAGTSQNKLLYR